MIFGSKWFLACYLLDLVSNFYNLLLSCLFKFKKYILNPRRSKKAYTLHQNLFFLAIGRLQDLPQGVRGFAPLLQDLARVYFSRQ
jgi:hypothetical protein